MDVKAFKTQWLGWYPDAPPIGHLLRELHSEFWLRIHSLPDSKRYPESADEWRELLFRQNAVATALLGEGGRCIIVTARVTGPNDRMPERLADSPTRDSEALLALNPLLVGWLDESWPGANATRTQYEDSRVWLYAAPVTWVSGGHDALLRAAANDETGGVVVVECSGGRVYAPYDGGADLFFRSITEQRSARDRYRAWLSALPSGL